MKIAAKQEIMLAYDCPVSKDKAQRLSSLGNEELIKEAEKVLQKISFGKYQNIGIDEIYFTDFPAHTEMTINVNTVFSMTVEGKNEEACLKIFEEACSKADKGDLTDIGDSGEISVISEKFNEIEK